MITLLNFDKKYKSYPIVLGLGFFDSVHLGHISLLEKVKEFSSSLNAEATVFTLSTNPKLSKNNEKQVFTFNERLNSFETLNIKNVMFSPFNENFRKLSGLEFIDKLLENFNIKAIVCGKDFKFGKNAKWDAQFLKAYLKEKNIHVEILNFYKYNGEKLSTTFIRNLIQDGDLTQANKLLTIPYFIESKVINQKGRGKTFGMPTANMQLDNTKIYPPEGVYASTIKIDGKEYPSVTNIGIKPTFKDNDYAIESHIMNFDGNIYEKTVKLTIIKKLRNIEQFENVESLKKQIKKDIENRNKLENIW